MFDLPGLEGVKEMVISRQVVDGIAPPLYNYGPLHGRRRGERLSRSGRGHRQRAGGQRVTSANMHRCGRPPRSPSRPFAAAAHRAGKDRGA